MTASPPASALVALLEHKTWATDELLAFCERLPAMQLAATAPGAFGTIFETLHHFIESDGHYVRRVAPQLWPADLHPDANDAWAASLGGDAAFAWVRDGGPEASRLERRRIAFQSGNLPEAFARLRARATELARLWHEYAEAEPDVSVRRPFWPDSESSAAVQVAQALQHSHAHQEQVCTILTTLDLEPPDLSGLRWGSAIGDVRSLDDNT